MPLLSVVMPAHNTETYIGEALRSLDRQLYPNIEVIVVDDGSTDGTAEIVRAAQAHDPRVRLVQISHVGPGAARNVGSAQAQGAFIAFLDSDDLVNPLFYRQAVLGLQKSGSDFAVAPYEILVRGRRRPPAAYILDVHRRARQHITLADLPMITVNVPVWARVFRRDFYERSVFPLPEGILFEDQLPAMQAFVRARAFDVLRRSGVQWRRRAAQDSIVQQTSDADNLGERIRSYRSVTNYLAQSGLFDLKQERTLQLLATDQLTLQQLVVASQEYFESARDYLIEAMADVDGQLYADRVSLPDRVLHALIADTDLETTQSFLLSGGQNKKNWVFRRNHQGDLEGWLPRWGLDKEVRVPIQARRATRADRSMTATGPVFSLEAWDVVRNSPAAAQCQSVLSGSGTTRSVDQTMALRCWYWTGSRAMCAQIYLQCGHGSDATDTQVALARELDRRDLGDKVIWGVSQDSTVVPRGQRRVVVGSPEYYQALRTSAVLCFNADVPEFLVSHTGQTVIQTGPGHPFEAVGVPRWRHNEETDLRIRLNLEQRNRWDVVVSPSALATQLNRQCFPVRAEMWELGTPRNDALVLPPSGARDAIRESLGLGPDQVAVLYVPSDRKYSLENVWTHPYSTVVNPHWLARQLGKQYVILMRGKLPTGRVRSVGNVIDVTHYPEINDLILASDCGLFDYSPVRFDYSTTDKPMAYIVLDKEEYAAASPFLWPYEETIAGPCVSDRESLPVSIRRAVEESHRWSQQREELRHIVAPRDDGNASARLADRVCALLG